MTQKPKNVTKKKTNWRFVWAIATGILAYSYWYTARTIMLGIGLDDPSGAMAFGLSQFSSFLLAIGSIYLIVNMYNKDGT